MRRRIKEYHVNIGNTVFIMSINVGIQMTGYSTNQLKECIRLIIDEDVPTVIVSSMRKDTISSISASSTYISIRFDKLKIKNVERIASTDSFTIEVDTGEVPMEVSAITDTFINALT